MTWAQSTYERGNRQTCSTRLRSNLVIRADGHGAALPSTTKDGTTAYADVQPGYLIEWSAKTESDGRGRPDRITARLTRLNTVYLAGLINNVTSTNPNATQSQLVDLIVEQADPNQLFSILSSQTVQTNADGTASGILPTAGAPPGPATVLIHYGYSSVSERSDGEKMADFWSGEAIEEVISIMIGAAVCGATTVASAGTLAVLGCSLGISLAVAFTHMGIQYAKDAFGLIDTNKHGCTFPLGGHNHSYAIAIGGDAGAIQAASGSGLTPAATESSLARGGLPVSRILISAGITAAAILLIVSAFGGDQS